MRTLWSYTIKCQGRCAIGKQQAPKPPDVNETAAAQTKSNLATATAQANLNQVNQVNPSGSLTYTTTGTNPDGTPIRLATTALSSSEQGIFDAGQGTRQNLADVAKTQSGRIGGLLAAPNDFNTQKDYLNGLTSGALDKTWTRDEARLRSALADKGIAEGSDAYNRELDNFRQSKSQAYNSANAANFTTAQASQTALRNQPLNEILALAGMSGVSSPTFGSTPQTGVAGTDIAGLTNSNYAQQLAAVNAANNNTSQTLGGLFGIGTSLIRLSDARTKTDIHYDGGETEDGIPTAEYRYKWEPEGTVRHGVIAQDVAKRRPDAIQRIGGFMAVDARKIPEAV